MRVRLEAATGEWLEALVVGDECFTERFGIPVAEGWAGFPEALPVLLDGVRTHGPSMWGPHLFFDGDGVLVGLGGFKGPPHGGFAEVGYAVAPARQGRGIATQATTSMIEQARHEGLERVIAHTLPEQNASTTVLERCGFSRAGVDLEAGVDGEVWRWELGLRSP